MGAVWAWVKYSKRKAWGDLCLRKGEILTDTLVNTLEDFIKDFHCPLTNLHFSPTTDPLENHQ
jgi:hypothetical protein